MKGAWGLVTGADCVVSPPWPFTLFFTGTDRGFLLPSLDSRVQIWPFCPRRLSWMLSRTAARASSAQGASHFAAGHAAVRFTHHSDGRPVHIMKTSSVTACLCLRMSWDSRVQIGPFCPRRPFISLSRVQIVGFCPRRLIYVCIFGLSAPVVLLIVRHV